MNTSSLSLAFLALAMSGCGHGPKERTAPCPRPLSLAAFAGERVDPCGPLTRINGDHGAVVDALRQIVEN